MRALGASIQLVRRHRIGAHWAGGEAVLMFTAGVWCKTQINTLFVQYAHLGLMVLIAGKTTALLLDNVCCWLDCCRANIHAESQNGRILGK